jgi:hypothetical protein
MKGKPMTAITASTHTASTHTASDSLARLAIRLDGIVVGLLGLAMVIAAGPASSLSGLPTAAEYGVGALCVAYLPLAFVLAGRPRVRTTAFVLAGINLATTIAVIAAVLIGAPMLTPAGTEMALAIGIYTAAIGILQYAGARRA